MLEYEDTFSFPVSVQCLWATISRLEAFPSLWTWLHDFSFDGDGLNAGTVLHGVVAPPLPYRMRLDVRLDACEYERSISASVHGDLEGSALLTFEGDNGCTHAHARWTLEIMQRPMRLAARFAFPLLQWGHDHVVAATVDSFRRHIEVTGER